MEAKEQPDDKGELKLDIGAELSSPEWEKICGDAGVPTRLRPAVAAKLAKSGLSMKILSSVRNAESAKAHVDPMYFDAIQRECQQRVGEGQARSESVSPLLVNSYQAKFRKWSSQASASIFEYSEGGTIFCCRLHGTNVLMTARHIFDEIPESLVLGENKVNVKRSQMFGKDGLIILSDDIADFPSLKVSNAQIAPANLVFCVYANGGWCPGITVSASGGSGTGNLRNARMFPGDSGAPLLSGLSGDVVGIMIGPLNSGPPLFPDGDKKLTAANYIVRFFCEGMSKQKESLAVALDHVIGESFKTVAASSFMAWEPLIQLVPLPELPEEPVPKKPKVTPCEIPGSAAEGDSLPVSNNG